MQGLESDNLDVTYLYCGKGFADSSGLNMSMIQDGQHPSVLGYEALGRSVIISHGHHHHKVGNLLPRTMHGRAELQLRCSQKPP